jgi:PPOX class probable F420-dependent enzyme
MLSELERAFLDRCRVARLATADTQAHPHIVPVCFALEETSVYITIDAKPKRGDARNLKRLRNIRANPAVALIADLYDDRDWSRLAWVLLRGTAEILESGPEHDRAQDLLRARYAQYRTMPLGDLPVIAIRIAQGTSWGDLRE